MKKKTDGRSLTIREWLKWRTVQGRDGSRCLSSWRAAGWAAVENNWYRWCRASQENLSFLSLCFSLSRKWSCSEGTVCHCDSAIDTPTHLSSPPRSQNTAIIPLFDKTVSFSLYAGIPLSKPPPYFSRRRCRQKEQGDGSNLDLLGVDWLVRKKRLRLPLHGGASYRGRRRLQAHRHRHRSLFSPLSSSSFSL